MRLERLHLTNYRGFETLELRFPLSGPAVLIGVNGAGKSTILDGIAIFLARRAALAGARDPAIPYAIRPRDVRRGARGESCAVADFLLEGDPGSVRAEIRSVPDPFDFDAPVDPYTQWLRTCVIGEETNLPVLCYYHPNRGMGSGESNGKASKGRRARAAGKPIAPQVRAYEHAFSSNVGPFQEMVRWFRLEEDRENEVRLRKDPEHRNARLEGVRRAVLGLMNALGSHTFENLRMERGLTEESLDLSSSLEASLLVDKAGQGLSMDQLSEGEKGALLLAADLAMRLVIANPRREDPLAGSGIVLIDEVDIHLHPAWQRAMLPGLSRTFPGCQIIVTTHSPEVLGQVHPESVFMLEDFRLVEETPPTYGRDASSILEDHMGVPRHPEEAARRIHRLGELIDQEDLDGARSELSELARWFGDHDAEVVRLRSLVEFMAR